MSNIFISTSSFDLETQEIRTLKEMGFEIHLNPLGRRLTAEEIASFLANKNIVGLLAGVEPINETVLMQAKYLKTISRCGVGIDNIDITAAQNLGISITNTPDAPTRAVAELALGLTLSVLRKIPHQDASIRSGEWVRPMGNLIYGKTIGVLGLGRIGAAYARIMLAMGAKVIAHDPYLKISPDPNIQLVEMPELLSSSDILSLHTPGANSDDPLINKNHIEGMKSGAILINTARGHLVDEEALLDALESGQLSGAGLDVYAEEPYKGSLTKASNVVLTAHTGSYAKEARAMQEKLAAQNLIDELRKINL